MQEEILAHVTCIPGMKGDVYCESSVKHGGNPSYTMARCGVRKYICRWFNIFPQWKTPFGE